MAEFPEDEVAKEYECINSSDDSHGPMAQSDILKDVNGDSQRLIVENSSVIDSSSVQKTERDEPYNLMGSTVPNGSLQANGNLNSGKPSSIAQLVRTWETFMMNPDGHCGDQFEPLQVFQQLTLCGAGDGLLRLGPPLPDDLDPRDGGLFDPISLRHTHSSPLHCTPSMIDDDGMKFPPIGLERFHRSRSTPLTTSANSAFGTILKTSPYIGGRHDRSAFTLTSQRRVTSGSHIAPRFSAFDPIASPDEMDVTERTSIEVTKLSPPRNRSKSSYCNEDIEDGKSRTADTKDTTQSAASRAAKFLSDVRTLRRRRRGRCGRENPARPLSSQEESANRVDNIEEASNNIGSSTLCQDDSNVIDMVTKVVDGSETFIEEEGKEVDDSHPVGINYQKLESDDESDRFQTISSPIDAVSPSTIPSPIYHHMVDERVGDVDVSRGVQIQVSNVTTHPFDEIDTTFPTYSSPIPAQMARDGSSLTPHSHDSPGTLRSSGTTNTSGHTTHATNTTVSSGQMSHLSSISETDREVMEANKVGSLLRHDRSSPVVLKNEFELLGGNSSALGYALGYFALRNSPENLREGANVEADRFFTGAESKAGSSRRAKVRTSSSSKKGTSCSPTTNTLASLHTSSRSSSAGGDEPPTFVSYLERQVASDLTTLPDTRRKFPSIREGRGDLEERESPSEILGYSDVIFEEAKAPRDKTSKQPLPIRLTDGQLFRRRVRSLPPRSPVKGGRAPTTPPPRVVGGESTSPALCRLSPPRTIVDHRIEPVVSRPYVLRTTPGSSTVMSRQKMVVVSPEGHYSSGAHRYAPVSGDGASLGAQEVVREPSNTFSTGLSRGPMRSRTYVEHSIEILKADSKEERGTPSPSLFS